MNKKGEISSGLKLIGGLIIMALLLMIIYNQLLAADTQGQKLVEVPQQWLENWKEGQRNQDRPCPCSDDPPQRIQVDSTVYCVATVTDSNQCEAYGFTWSSDNDACYYSNVQCINFLSSST